ncbi:MAG: alpha/beta fold hydrolase [Alphaproteobacteria bacterium]|nr:alpha/beta fold hydrolase [Alphaproteobacteria bacterium]MBV9904328.1 alpha/beta fold hydrolase [Alphaproteobacteria bacterium]
MAQIKANGINLEYDVHGPENGEPVLLIMGLGAQMTRWPAEFIAEFTRRGYRVIRFDNRDVGLSHKFHDAGPGDIAAIMAARMQGKSVTAAYNVDDMANDAVGLLDALGIKKAHIVGASMGGMIAQMVAAQHPEKTLSLTSIMSSTGNPGLPSAKPEAMAILMNRPESEDVEYLAGRAVTSARTIGSPGYPAAEADIRARFHEDYKRSYYPIGVTRQMAAVMASGDRREALKKIKAPTVVVHGVDDALVPVEGGRDTVANIAGATIVEIPGMGHDLPPALYKQVVDAFESVAKKARATA